MASTPWQDGLRRLLHRVDATGERVTDGFPHYGDPATGRWVTSPGGDWTGGFWNGLCWLAAHRTGEARYRSWAQQWTERLRPRAHSDTIFRGFLFYYGALVGSVLLADPLAREVALQGAKGLAASFNPTAGVLPLGTEAEEASDVGRGESSIDGVQGAALLVWAAQESGDPSLRQMAVSHARRHNYLLAGGFVRCATCGRMLTGRMTSRGKRRYRCTSRVNVLDVTQRCRGSLAADDVEGRVWQAVERVLENPALIAQEVHRQQAESEALTADIQRDLALLASMLLKCQREDDRWTAAYAAEVIDLAELKAYRAEIAARRQGLHEQEWALEAKQESVHRGLAQVEALTGYCARVRERLQTFDIEEKRLALQALDIQVTWAIDQPLQVRGSVPVEGGAIVSNPVCRAVCPA